MAEYPVWPEEELREIAGSLSPAMRHALLRCSDALDWTQNREVTWARDWCDVVAHFRMCTFRGTLRALERRQLVEIDTRGSRGVRATLLGLAVRALFAKQSEIG